jgi:hypothetical protein
MKSLEDFVKLLDNLMLYFLRERLPDIQLEMKSAQRE